jgi:uncharacterized protein YbcI
VYETDGHPATGQIAMAVSNAVVRVFVEHIGRGPTRARAVFGPNLITVVLRESLTKAERRLVEAGEVEPVIAARQAFHRAMESDLIAAVERVTGRRVDTVLCDQKTDPDVSVQVFLLEPEPERALSAA